MIARPGRVSSWLTTFAERATRTAPLGERVFQRAHSGIPTSFSVPVVAPGAEVGAEAALRPAPEVVGQPDRRDGRHRRDEQTDDGADEGEPEAAIVPCQRPAGEREVDELARAMREARDVSTGRSVLQVERSPRGRRGRLAGRRSSFASRRRNPRRPGRRRRGRRARARAVPRAARACAVHHGAR